MDIFFVTCRGHWTLIVIDGSAKLTYYFDPLRESISEDTLDILDG